MNFRILAFLLLAFGSLKAQFVPKLENFQAQHKDGIVYLNWVFSPGSVCLGIKIERSEDSVNYNEIGFIGGICGNLTTPAYFSYEDDNPILNKKIFYRLSYPNLGTSGSISLMVIDVPKNEYQANPTPSNGITRLNFYNPKLERHYLKLSNISGVVIMEADTRDLYFELDVSTLDAGIYQFYISNDSGSNTVSGRILVAR